MDYVIIEKGKNEWAIVDKNKTVIDTITKDIIINRCERNLGNDNADRADYMNANGLIDDVWCAIQDEYDLEFVDDRYQEWEKFCAWFDYIVVEYFANKIIAFYKQRLLDFE